ncbi:MAG: CAAX prenyl protease-related protein [Verrucomicrobiota bacterium]
MIATFREYMAKSPEHARFLPFAIWVGITALAMGGGNMMFYSYVAKVLVGAWIVWEMRRYIPEVRWTVSWQAIVVGIVVFFAWVGLDPFYPKNTLLMKDTPESIWNPFARYGDASVIAWTLIVIRIFGMTVLVPPIEEAFYRSLVYRYIVKYDFTKVALNHVDGVALVLCALLFGFMHFQWLPGIMCGMAYQWLVFRRGHLGDAMTAHAITNFLLGVYVVWKGGEAWKFF